MQWILLLIILCVIAYFIPDRKDKNVEDRIYTIPDGDEKQVSALDKLSRKYNRISVVFVKNESESGIYEACAGKHSLGTVKATARIEKIVGDGSYKAQILLRYWNESGHNKHYSAVDVFKL